MTDHVQSIMLHVTSIFKWSLHGYVTEKISGEPKEVIFIEEYQAGYDKYYGSTVNNC